MCLMYPTVILYTCLVAQYVLYVYYDIFFMIYFFMILILEFMGFSSNLLTLHCFYCISSFYSYLVFLFLVFLDELPSSTKLPSLFPFALLWLYAVESLYLFDCCKKLLK